MIASTATAIPIPMPAFSPVDMLVLLESVDEATGARVEVVVVGEDDDDEKLTNDVTGPLVCSASARIGADFGTKWSKSDDCHATEMGLANATVTEASPGNCFVWICVQDHCKPLV